MRKASWYAAVAVSVFETETSAVAEAIKTAQAHEPKIEVFTVALKCRAAPEGWTG
jgi:hypothetical protein